MIACQSHSPIAHHTVGLVDVDIVIRSRGRHPSEPPTFSDMIMNFLIFISSIYVVYIWSDFERFYMV